MGVDTKKSQSYNRDRYERPQSVHDYILNGDPLNKGVITKEMTMRDIAARNRATNIDADVVDEKMYVSNYQKHYGHAAGGSKSAECAAVTLPKNIEHLFGSKVCRDLLSDREKIARTLEEQARDRARRRKERPKVEPGSQSKLDGGFTSYEYLGNALRHDHFPGYTCDHTSTLHRDVYTNDVYKSRVPVPDQWRYRKDELSKCSELEFIRESSFESPANTPVFPLK